MSRYSFRTVDADGLRNAIAGSKEQKLELVGLAEFSKGPDVSDSDRRLLGRIANGLGRMPKTDGNKIGINRDGLYSLAVFAAAHQDLRQVVAAAIADQAPAFDGFYRVNVAAELTSQQPSHDAQSPTF